MKTIGITDIEGLRIGQAEDAVGATGVTALVFPEGAAASIDVRGGGPASRDTRILDPLAAAEFVHAVVLAGGSAFGLDAAGGVMRCLEERGIGLPVGSVRVPLVCQSDIFDLLVGSADARPDVAMGRMACEAAFEGEHGNYRDGNFGAGCGATVGKLLGPDFCMKTGIGSHAVQVGPLQVGCIVALNAIGDVTDPATGQTVAGLRDLNGIGFRSTAEIMYEGFEEKQGLQQPDVPEGLVANTTIGAVITNAKLSKAQLCKLAGMAHDGYARAIRPVHTSMDGDSIYGISVGNVEADLDLVGTLAADVMVGAILSAARNADPAYGLPSAKSL